MVSRLVKDNILYGWRPIIKKAFDFLIHPKGAHKGWPTKGAHKGWPTKGGPQRVPKGHQHGNLFDKSKDIFV